MKPQISHSCMHSLLRTPTFLWRHCPASGDIPQVYVHPLLPFLQLSLFSPSNCSLLFPIIFCLFSAPYGCLLLIMNV